MLDRQVQECKSSYLLGILIRPELLEEQSLRREHGGAPIFFGRTGTPAYCPACFLCGSQPGCDQGVFR